MALTAGTKPGKLTFSLLGPLEVAAAGDPLPLRGRRERALLAYLLLHVNEVVSRDRLVDFLWGERPPETAANALQVAVHGLRRLLGPDRIETRGAGYRLRVEPGELDLTRFRELVERAHSQGPVDAAATLREALALWRGEPLADVAGPAFVRDEADRLKDLRLTALEARIDADLAAGRDADLVPELEELIAEEPFRERLRAQLITALYRSGRQADALAAYQAARRTLADELGIDPSPELQELERAVLRHDPSLAPPAPQPARPPTNLPAPATPLVGRALERAAVSALLRSGDVRLLTLTGPGGTGKTRLALAVAEDVLEQFPDGVCFVPLARLRDPALVPSAIARAVGVEERGTTPLMEVLARDLHAKRTLLVLDNFEHVSDAALVVSELVSAAPALKALVTSRAPLHLSGEHEYPVPPLPLPDPRRLDDAEVLATNEAVALFVARARAARPDFRLDDDARAVADVCVALEGLPLALELAAARVKTLPVATLRERLVRRLPVLVGGPRDVDERQQTLRAAIGWSHDLLSAEEQQLFRRLSVFSGGFDLAAAQAVAQVGFEALDALADKSLLRRVTSEEPRFDMLETIREYAAERLEEDGPDGESVRRRHAEHFLELAEEADRHLTGADAARWLDRLEREHDNFRAAIAFAAASRAADVELRLATALRYFWWWRGHLSEGRRWLEAALARGGHVEPSVRARALRTTAVLVSRQGEAARSKQLYGEALELFREIGDTHSAARTLAELGAAALGEGDHETATRLFEEVIPLFREAGDERALTVTLSNLAAAASLQGDYERGRTLTEEVVSLLRERAQRDQLAMSLHNLARVCARQGDLDEASTRLAESLEIAVELGYREVIAYCLEGAAELAAARGDAERAARLLGAGDALFEALGVAIGPEEADGYAQTVARLGAELGERQLDAVRAEGRAVLTDDALADAFSVLRS